MRVLHVVPAAPFGGTSIFTRRQIDLLSASGVESTEVLFAGAAMVRQPHRFPLAIRAIRRAVSEFKPQIVHAHWGSLLGFASCVSTLGGPPLVVTFRGSDLNPVETESAVRSSIKLFCSQATALAADRILCVSDQLRARLWWGVEKCHIVPDGTDFGVFRPRSKELTRNQVGWPQASKVVLFNAGNRPIEKRLDLAERAFEQAKLRLPDLRLELLNGDKTREEVAQRICASDCVLLTSDYEGSPNIVREALACGVPVVTVPVGDVSRWLKDVEGARIVERTPSMLGSAIADLILMGEKPIPGDAFQVFSEIRSREDVLAIYQEMLAERVRIPTPASS